MIDRDDLLIPPPPGPLDIPLLGSGITGLTPAIAKKLEKGLGLVSVRDLLETVPRRYIDLSRTRQIEDVRIGEDVTITCTVAKVDGRHLRSRRHLLNVLVGDGSGYVTLVYWNQPFRTRQFTVGTTLAVAGKVEKQRGKLQIVNPFVEKLSGDGAGVHTGRIIPVHPATSGVTATQIRRFVHAALERFGDLITEPLPDATVAAHSLMDRTRAIRALHFPSEERARHLARRRLVFEELTVLSAGLAVRKHRLRERATGIAHADGRAAVDDLFASLPFDPTGAQRRVIDEIARDLAVPHPMNRLLQGEVGSGKTVVALAAALIANAGGYQTAFMAPTEVLAEQHLLTVRALLEPLAADAPATGGRLFGSGPQVELLTGSVTGKDRARALERIASGEASIVVGTHALIQEGVTFANLGLAIVDEQHRFGVHQRILLRDKADGGAQPDLLIMTATPIPRTLALTLYGDLDVSTLDEMPPGRTPVATSIAHTIEKKGAAYEDIRDAAQAGNQAFIICPLVEDSLSLEVKAARSEFDRITADVFPDLRVGLIHGRMKSAEKEEVMDGLRAGEIDVLVATTVIEVGVDIPNATVLIIEDADRFGLSQLHQLRGRVGRGSAAARCYLFTTLEGDEASRAEAIRRLKAMEASTDGFELAEVDLEIRGAGHLFGRGAVGEGGAPAQAGRGDLQFANLVRDVDVLVQAREEAFAIVQRDPTLSAPENATLMEEVRRRFADRLDWLFAT